MDLEGIILSEISQIKTDNIWFHSCVESKNIGINKQKVSFDIIGQYSEKNKRYFHSLIIKEEDTKEDSFSEKVVEDKIDKENEE